MFVLKIKSEKRTSLQYGVVA